MTSLEFLRNVEGLKGLIDNKLAGIQDHCHEKQYRYDEKLFDEGDEASCLWIVKEGQVDLRFDLPNRPTSAKNTISSMSKYMTFGWSGLVAPYKYRLSAYCATEFCTVIQIEREKLLKIFEEDSKIGYVVMSNLVEIIGKRFHQLQDSAWISPYASIKIMVHLATCGIAAGAREVMSALMDEMALTDRLDIRILSGGCIGKCETEPNVTVEIEGEDPVVYQKMNPDKMRKVFKKHILEGQVQAEFTLG
jgi:NADP-reducing hydrogenase subunit HndB